MGRQQPNLCKAVHTTKGRALENPRSRYILVAKSRGKPLFELIVKIDLLENSLRLPKAKGVSLVRNLGPVALLVLILVTNSFAASTVVKSSVFPEPGLLVLLGGGLVGLATLIRRHLSD